ncbi:unnamed protein product [Symbiodinium natans]|uniref:Uncharacterized protein n=1 Tax=Symbiodinium natans TaxID=878477 RepID=A0A812RFZ3_9DINO|nr:unnamed protein product [Symbiodinium natans]
MCQHARAEGLYLHCCYALPYALPCSDAGCQVESGTADCCRALQSARVRWQPTLGRESSNHEWSERFGRWQKPSLWSGGKAHENTYENTSIPCALTRSRGATAGAKLLRASSKLLRRGVRTCQVLRVAGFSGLPFAMELLAVLAVWSPESDLELVLLARQPSAEPPIGPSEPCCVQADLQPSACDRTTGSIREHPGASEGSGILGTRKACHRRSHCAPSAFSLSEGEACMADSHIHDPAPAVPFMSVMGLRQAD